VIEPQVSRGFSTRSKERVCSIADEAIVPNISSSKHPGEGGDVVDNRFNWAFFPSTHSKHWRWYRRWVSSPQHRNWGTAIRSGFDVSNLSIKGLAYRSCWRPPSTSPAGAAEFATLLKTPDVDAIAIARRILVLYREPYDRLCAREN
jgi:hypothetical protein